MSNRIPINATVEWSINAVTFNSNGTVSVDFIRTVNLENEVIQLGTKSVTIDAITVSSVMDSPSVPGMTIRETIIDSIYNTVTL